MRLLLHLAPELAPTLVQAAGGSSEMAAGEVASEARWMLGAGADAREPGFLARIARLSQSGKRAAGARLDRRCRLQMAVADWPRRASGKSSGEVCPHDANNSMASFASAVASTPEELSPRD